jgi:DNA-binding MarR family transcriptional regulator
VVREVLDWKLLRETSPLPLTLSQFHLLKLMAFNGQHQLNQIAEFLGVSPPAATKNIDKLEGLGLVIRTRDRDDRRATLLSVSHKGRRLVQRYEELKLQRLKPVLAAFRPEELESLADLMERFAVELLDREKPGGDPCLRCSAYIVDACLVGRARGGCPYEKVQRYRGPREGRSSGQES